MASVSPDTFSKGGIATVILAAGKGTRMFSDRPKVLHEICGKPMLGYVLQQVREIGINQIYVVIGYQGDKVQKTFKSEPVFWVNQGEQRGTGHAFSITAPMLNGFEGNILVLYGDAPLITSGILKKLFETHQGQPPIISGQAETAATILTCQLENPFGYGRVLRDDHGQIQAVIEEVEATDEQKKTKEVNAGFYVFNPAIVYPLLKELKPHSKNGEYYLTDIVGLLVNRGKRVAAYQAPEPGVCLGINSPAELINATRLMRQRVTERLLAQGVTIIDPANTYIEPDVAIGRDTVIYPFTVIKGKVTIGKNCSVGPFTHLREGTVLKDYAKAGNFTELKKTLLGERSKVNHLSYLGDTIVGEEVNIGAGTITANYDGKSKYQTSIEDGASIGSGTILIAPVKIGKGAVTGAGAVVSKGQNVKNGETVVGIPAAPLKKKKKK